MCAPRIRSGPADSVAADRNAIVGWLVGGSVLGLVGWWMTRRAIRRRSPRQRLVAVSWLALGTVWAIASVSVGGEAYDVIVPRVFGLLTLLPVVAGVAVLHQVWRGSASAARWRVAR